MKFLNTLVPQPRQTIDFDALGDLLGPLCQEMKDTQQSPIHHGEGDVWTHTCMVLNEILSDSEWSHLSPEEQFILFWAGVFHDSGKPARTVVEDGLITSPGHSRTGAHIARAWLGKRDVPFHLREQICALILHHQKPFWLFEREDAPQQALQIHLSTHTKLLMVHARGDARGRICADQQDLLDKIALSGLLFDEVQPLEEPLQNGVTRMAVLRQNRWAHDPTITPPQGSKVIVVCGLPGAGKDTWLGTHHPKLPMVSPDVWRRELGLKRKKDGLAIQNTKEDAKAFLRAKEDFCWNATHLSANLRGQTIDLLLQYDAHVSLVWIEPNWNTWRQQNQNRTHALPNAALDKMYGFFEPPTLLEAHDVQYITDI